MRARIAIVDDDRSVRNALRRLLTTANLQTRVFSSGQQFLGAMRDYQPDCLIIDVKMPDMNGRELLYEVWERIPNLPVIIMTAFDQPGSHAEYDNLGAAYLLKPIEEKDLFAAIKAALRAVVSDSGDFIYRPELDQSPIEKQARRGS